jgi:hypothetical protein
MLFHRIIAGRGRHLYIAIVLILIARTPVAAQSSVYEADWEYSGDIAVSAFGWAMCVAGDVNGDGYEDLLVAAIDHSEPVETEEEEGKLYLFYGGPDGLATTPAWTYQPNDDLTILGFDVAGGDLNGDGYSDIVAGNLQWTGDIAEQGKISLWYGGPDGPGDAPDWEFLGDQPQGLMGSGVALEGDINNDGYNDLFISSKMYDNPEENEGKVWMFWGSADGPVGPVWSWEPNQSGTIAGFPVNYAGDVNGDGYDDVVIGANNYTNTLNRQGMAVGFYGGADGLAESPDWATYGENKKDYFGHWVDGAGDVNGDGYDDVIVSAILFERDSLLGSEGAAYVFLGGTDGIATDYIWRDEGNLMNTQFGYCVSSAGDVNGDGYDEIIVGSKYWENTAFKEGSAAVYWGSPSGPEPDYCFFAEGQQDSAYLGRHVDGGGDFNNDGYADFLAGAYRYSNVYEQDGIVYAYYGKPREAAFHLAAENYCITEVDPLPIYDGLEGGLFAGSDGLVIDVATGAIDLSASTPGTHTIYYTFEGFCTQTDSTSLTIYELPDPGFSYSADFYFNNESNPTPILSDPGGSGEWSASPDGLVFADPVNGTIQLSASIPGTFVITYTTSNAACTAAASFEITIEEACLSTVTPVIAGVTTSTVSLEWEAGAANVTGYNIWVIADGDTTYIADWSGTSITIDGLAPGTEYSVFIQSVCGAYTAPEGDAIAFTTTDQVGTTEIAAMGVEVYPNPAGDLLYIDAQSLTTSEAYIEIFNMQQQLQQRLTLPAGALHTLPLQLAPGNYLLRVTAGSQTGSTVLTVAQ